MDMWIAIVYRVWMHSIALLLLWGILCIIGIPEPKVPITCGVFNSLLLIAMVLRK